MLVVDLHLPDLSGQDVCRRLRASASTARLPILAVSAVSDQIQAERTSLEAGATAFITDEADTATFVAAVRDVLGGNAAK